MSHHQPSPSGNGEQFPHPTAAERGLAAAAGERPLLEAARRAEGRTAEVLAAMAGLDAETAAFEDRLQARLAQRLDQLRDRLLLSSGQTLQALDRALEATRTLGQRIPLMADAIRVRRQLAGLLDDETETCGDTRDPLATLVEMPAGPSAAPAPRLSAETLSDAPAPASWRAAARTHVRPSETIEDRVGATLVVAEPEAAVLRPAAKAPVKVPHAAARPPIHRDESRRGVVAAVLFTLLGILVVRGALIGPWLGTAAVKPEAARRPAPPPDIPEEIQKVPPHSVTEDSAPLPPASREARGPQTGPMKPPIAAPGSGPRRVDTPAAPPLPPPPLPADAAEGPTEPAPATTARDAPAIAPSRFFQTQATVRDVAKASTGGSCGPWDGPCAKARVLDCKLEYTLTPAVPVPGQPVRIEVMAINTGEKTLKVQSLTAVVAVNGDQTPHPIVAVAKDLGRGERKVIGQVEDVWKPGTNSWWLEATVKDQKGDSYRAQFTWELRAVLR